MAKWLARRHPGVGSPKSPTNRFFFSESRESNFFAVFVNSNIICILFGIFNLAVLTH